MDDGVTLFVLGRLCHELTDLAGMDVDVVPASMLKPRLCDGVFAEANPLQG